MSGWTEERVARLRKLWLVDGLSCTEIAEALGGVSRNAVIGKLHRIGVAPIKKKVTGMGRPRKDGSRSKRTTKPAKNITQNIPAATKAESDPKRDRATSAKNSVAARKINAQGASTEARAWNGNSPAPAPGSKPPTPISGKPFDPTGRETIGIMDLRPTTCRFPFDANEGETVRYCGHPVVPGESWCPAHHEIVFGNHFAVSREEAA